MPEVGQWGPEPFLSRDGRPTADITVTVYEEDGITPAVLYADQDGIAVLANPLPTGVPTTTAGVDVRGNGTFYAEPGTYVLAVVRASAEVYRSPVTVAVGDGTVTSTTIDAIETLSLAAYAALAPPDPATLYFIT